MPRQHTEPLIVLSGSTTSAMRLTRVSLAGEDGQRLSEDWLQQLLFEHPELLPIEDIEAAFAPALPVCRELPTPAGPLDLLFANANGLLTLVECKLWRNPEARREVVAQILDYAKELSRWSYADLVKAVSRATGSPGDPLYSVANGSGDALASHEFADAVSRNLRKGRFLLLVVGDGIRESVEELAAFLHAHGHLNFTLALVEETLHRLPSELGGHLLVSPRIVSRTVEIERAVVRVIDGSIEVSAPSINDVSGAPTTGRRIKLTEELFFEQFAVAAEIKSQLREFLVEAADLDIVADVKAHLHVKTPDLYFNFGTFQRDGEFRNYNALRLNRYGDLGTRYLQRLAELIPNGRVEQHENPFLVTVRQGSRPVPASVVLANRAPWLALLADVRKEMLASDSTGTGEA